MANNLSPGITTKEYDVSTFVPAVSSAVGAIGGVYTWGPVEDPQLISSPQDLENRFGKPTADNYETFLISSNYLAYSDALYVSRAADASAFNAVANTGNVANTQIKNEDHFTTLEPTLPANSQFYAKYPGKIGNSLKISVCASGEAFKSTITNASANTTLEIEFTTGSNIATITVEDIVNADDTVATNDMTTVLDLLFEGDFIKASDGIVGTQFLKLKDKGTPSTATGIATADLTLQSRFTLSSTITSSTIDRNWEYFQTVDRAPATSNFVAERGGTGDELHIVVVDANGEFSGTPGTLLEVWDSLSRATDAKSLQGTANFYKEVLKDSSLFIYASNDIAGIASDVASSIADITVDPYVSLFAGGTNSATESAISLAPLANAYDKYKSTDDIDVSLLIAGKAIGGTHGEGIANYIIDNIATVRKDCVVCVSPQMNDVVSQPYQEVDNLVEFRNALSSSSYAFLTSAYKYQFDRYNNKYRWVAACGDDAGLMANTSNVRDDWWSPAGQNRGKYKNVIKLAFNPDKADRDVLYQNDINPVITKVGAGTMLYGDKTLLGKPSAFDRINVRRLFITLEKAISIASEDLLFEFNNDITRARFVNMVVPYLQDVKGRQGITRFKVVCDETNNTPQVIQSNQFVGSILIVPAKSINFITLNFYAVANTLSFEYVIGTNN